MGDVMQPAGGGAPSRSAIILVPTYKRPQDLRHLLASIAATIDHGVEAILVGDNDPEREFDLESVADEFRGKFAITCVHEPRKGLSSVRNRLIEEALARRRSAEFIVFVDDDMEIVSSSWLDNLMQAAVEANADLVGGPNVMPCTPDSNPWVRYSPLAAPKWVPDGPTEMLDGTCNLLVRLSFLQKKEAPRFDEAFNFFGGEDYDFFLRCRSVGATLAWCNNAATVERREVSRLNGKYFRQRLWNVGRYQALSDARWLTARGRALKKARIALSSFARAPFNLAKYGFIGAVVKFVYGIWFSLGYLTGSLGSPREMYRR